MKKIIVFSVLMASLLIQSTTVLLAAGNKPHGHKYYVRHSKHHKAHKLQRPHGYIDATYQN
jgi:hypothetical protein